MSSLEETKMELEACRAANIQGYIARFLKETGCSIEDVLLVEEHNKDSWTWRLARKKKKGYLNGLKSQNTFHPDQQ